MLKNRNFFRFFFIYILFAMNKRALSQYTYTASASFVHSASIFPIPWDVKVVPNQQQVNEKASQTRCFQTVEKVVLPQES